MDTSGDTPWTLGEITDGWLTSALQESGALGRGRVIGHEVGAAPDTGVVASAAPLSLNYDVADPRAPQSIYMKCTRHVPEICETEVGFYRDIAPQLGDIVPRCYGAWWDGGGRSTILLEDLSASGVGTWWTYTPDHAASAVEAIAAVHGAWWDRPPSFGWIHPSRSLTPDALGRLEQALEPFVSRHQFESAGILAEASKQILRKASQLTVALAEHPQTFTHQDFHSQNVFPRSRPDGRTAIFDWQFAATGPGGVDVAYHLAVSLSATDRRLAEDQLLRRYIAALAAHGVTAPGFRRQYALSLFRVVYVVTTTLGLYPTEALKPSNERALRFGVEDGWRELIDRVAAAITDHRFLSDLR